MKIFVTGGAGFIGSHLVTHLVKSGHTVTIYDNFSNSIQENTINFKRLGIHVIPGDITNYDLLESSMHEMDMVIHLAAQTDVNHSMNDPKFTNDINVNGTKNVLKSCVNNGVRNFIAASSAAVYGNSSQLEDSTVLPISPYGASKLDMERLLAKYSEKYNLNCISLRLFNVYGDGSTTGVIPKFLKYIRDKKELTIFGDGSNTRDFVYVCDVVLAITHFMYNLSGKRGDVYNVGTGQPTSILQLAKILMNQNDNTNIIFKDKIPGDIPNSLADIRKLKASGFECTVPLNIGISKMIDSTLS